MTPVTASAKEAAAAVVDQHLGELVSLSHSVHSTPELCFHETTSAHAVAEAIRAGGSEVDEGVYDLPTALESRAGEGELVVAVSAERRAAGGATPAATTSSWRPRSVPVSPWRPWPTTSD